MRAAAGFSPPPAVRSGVDTSSPARGARVASVGEGTPAANARIQEGDDVTTFEGEPIASAEDLIEAVTAREPGEHVTRELERDGSSTTVNLTFGARPS